MLVPAYGRVDPELEYDIRADSDGNGYIGQPDFLNFLAQFTGSGRPGPSGLACAGQPPCAGPLTPPSQSEHVLGRISYGANAESRARIQQIGAVAFIREQLAPSQLADPVLDARLALMPSLAMDVQQLDAAYDDAMPRRELTRARTLRILTGRRQLEELLVDFWLNHFNVYASTGQIDHTIVAYERDAIRPHVLGRFADLLRATARSAAMIDYLDNRFNELNGLNENYARELLELHTLGDTSSFTQADVVQAARALTGWRLDLTLPSGVRFDASKHDDGAKSLLGGVVIPAGSGESGMLQFLDTLARRTETASSVARKLVVRFVNEAPPSRLVSAAAQTFRSTNGDLAKVMETILLSPEFLDQTAHRRNKVKRPAVLIGSLARALGFDVDTVAANVELEIAWLGEATYLARPPTGYPDASDFWASPGGFVSALRLVEPAARGLEGYTPVFDVSATAASVEIADHLIPRLLPGGVSAGTRSGAVALAYELRRAPLTDRVKQVAAFLLSSPEFLLH